jgi:hypothetical protein
MQALQNWFDQDYSSTRMPTSDAQPLLKEKSVSKDGEECSYASNLRDQPCGFLWIDKRTQNKSGEGIDTNPIERICPRDSEIGMIYVEMDGGLVKHNAPIPENGGDRSGQSRVNQSFAGGFQLKQLK